MIILIYLLYSDNIQIDNRLRKCNKTEWMIFALFLTYCLFALTFICIIIPLLVLHKPFK